VKATDPYTVKVTLKQPQAPFLANLAIFAFGIASPKAVEKWGVDYGKLPIGTGPFKFVEWKPNQEVILDANPDYWGQKAKVKRVVVRNIKDNSARLAALKAGEVHAIEGINSDDLKSVSGDPNLYLVRRPANNTGYVAFNYHVKEFTDKRVRQAFAHAINKKATVDAFYGGLGLVATQLQPHALWGYNKEIKDYEYSAAKSQDLLKQAGFANGLSEITWRDGKKGALVLPVPSLAHDRTIWAQGDLGGRRRRSREGRHQGAAPDRRVGQLPGEAEEGRDAPLHDRVDWRQR
jgi:peptide/nickel transport system substrate-binding protein